MAVDTASTVVAAGTWTTGEWETAGDGVYYARVLLGDLDPGIGTWDVWLKIVDSAQTPIRYVGKLVLT